MKRIVCSLLAGVGLSLLSLSAQAQVSYQVTNFTFSGGDPIFPITDDVTFSSLVLTETFQDATTQAIPLYDPADPAQTPTATLNTSVFNLVSNSFVFNDPLHGHVASATLTGAFSVTRLGIQTSFGGPITTVIVNPTFTTLLDVSTLSAGNSLLSANIVAVNATTGTLYGAGTLAATGVPEPGSVALFAASGLGMVSVWRRRRK